MLESLSIENIGLVERLSLRFGAQVTILTGETGAGKSLIISSLLLLSGKGSVKTMLRDGAEEGSVEAVFRVAEGSDITQFLREQSITTEDGTLIIRKQLNAKGRTKSYIMGYQVTNRELQDCMQLLCEVYSQHEFQLLFKPAEQRKLLDTYAGLQEKVSLFFEQQKNYKHAKEDFLSLERMAANRGRELEYLDYAVKEISSASLQRGEDEKLQETMVRAMNSKSISTEISQIHAILDGEDGDEGSSSLFSRHFELIECLRRLANQLPSLTEQFTTHDKISNEYIDSLQGIKEKLRQYSKADETDIPAVEARISLIESLKLKYGKTIEQILEYYNEARTKMHDLTHIDTARESTLAKLTAQRETLKLMAHEIYEIRETKAKEYSARVNEILQTVGLQHADFLVKVFSPHDSPPLPLQFEISANKGEALRPLSAIASGGELSRIMLALKSISSNMGSMRTLILDEIDAGIGGKILRSVAQYLNQLGTRDQVICISHNATIAAVAETQIKIEKIQKGDRTVVSAIELDFDSRIKELSRMLVGLEDNDLAQEQSRHLLNEYGTQKASQ